MDKDRVKGAIDDAAGRAKRQVGEWTGDTRAQVEGAAQQVKGKAEKSLADLKDAVLNAKDAVQREYARHELERQEELERKRDEMEETETKHR